MVAIVRLALAVDLETLGRCDIGGTDRGRDSIVGRGAGDRGGDRDTAVRRRRLRRQRALSRRPVGGCPTRGGDRPGGNGRGGIRRHHDRWAQARTPVPNCTVLLVVTSESATVPPTALAPPALPSANVVTVVLSSLWTDRSPIAPITVVPVTSVVAVALTSASATAASAPTSPSGAAFAVTCPLTLSSVLDVDRPDGAADQAGAVDHCLRCGAQIEGCQGGLGHVAVVVATPPT